LRELRFAVAEPSAASTIAGLAAEGFWRLEHLRVDIIYSRRRLIDPASNVSVPFTVVMRTRSSVPERVTALE
jgi:hypothetical protein